MARYVILVAGNICAGKSKLTRYINEHKDVLAPFLPSTETTEIVPEFIDPEALVLFYQDRRQHSRIFEFSCLTSRVVRHMKAKHGSGIYIFDRGMIEGASTFSRNSWEEGFLAHDDYQRYLSDVKRAADDLDRRQQQRWLEQLVIHLKVDDVTILQERQCKRPDYRAQEGVIPAAYLQRINDLYNFFFRDIEGIYKKFGLQAPRVLTIDASVDCNGDQTFHQRVLEDIVKEVAKDLERHNV